ncbi:hypothetical protein [Microbacterium karelineae]|uniref:hypothetical protein n=1 Tax=Microbacterium karelineae TaxID=2654283 RepID=UPI0012EA55D4|nr:hypothetical protein [Microbacterium karelineae]
MPRANQLPKTPVKADAARRASEAWSLRVAGFTWEEIADQVGFSDAPGAHRAVKNFFDDVPQPDREQLRELARERGEALWKQAFADALEQRPGAVRAAVAVMQRQAALDGLDAPTRTEVSLETDREIDELVAEVLTFRDGRELVAGVDDDPA